MSHQSSRFSLRLLLLQSHLRRCRLRAPNILCSMRSRTLSIPDKKQSAASSSQQSQSSPQDQNPNLTVFPGEPSPTSLEASVAANSARQNLKEASSECRQPQKSLSSRLFA